MIERLNISSGAPWEESVGYSRAVRLGNVVEVAGTTSSVNGIIEAPGDAGEQTRIALQKIEAALHQAGASLADVVRTRIFVTDISRWEEVGRVHGEFFSAIRPVTTMVEISRLIDPVMMVEIEATAIINP